jgi:hypothetical protein
VTRYFTKVDDGLLPDVRSGDNMPRGLRLVCEVEHDGRGWTLVEFEDDDAPSEMEGAEVELTISAEYDEHGNVARTSVSSRTVVG